VALRFQPPHPFPNVSLPDLSGTEKPLVTAWAEGPALLVVGHRDCGTTRLALPFVDRIHRRRLPTASVIAILQDDPESARELVHDLDLTLPVRLEADPYPLSSELLLRTVPTLMLVRTDGRIARALEGFRRDELEALARELGVAGPLFAEADAGVPARRPG
jgi:hypothetical protein